MRKNYRKAQKQPTVQYRTNEAITASEVRLLDENGEHVGVVSLSEAMERAKNLELDLIEIEPKADPPVCKITSFGKLKYILEKELRKQKAKQKKVEVKGIRLSLRIGQHDLMVRQAQAKKFLEQNDKVRLEIVLRGRERQHTDLAKSIVKQFIDALRKEFGPAIAVDQDISLQGGRLSTTIGLKK